MTANLHDQQHTSDATDTPSQRRRVTRVALLGALLAMLGTAGATVGAGAASAATPVVSMTPQFDCYSSGAIVVDKPSLYENGQTVTWQPEVDVWFNGSWQFSRWGSQQTTTGTTAGELRLANETFSAAHGYYFKIEDWFYTSSNGWTSVQASAAIGGAPIMSAVCHVS